MKTLVVFATTAYAGIQTREQHIINRLTDAYTVIWINPPQRSTSVYLQRHLFGALTVITPITTQMKDGYSTEQINVIVPMLKRYITGPVDMWFFDPAAEPFIERFTTESVTYDVIGKCIPRGGYVDVRQNRLFTRANHLICQTEQLRDHYNLTNVLIVPNGVTAGLFDRTLVELRDELSCGAMPGVKLEISGTIIGYVGTIDRRIDFHLVDELAVKNPNLQIVMVGPVVDLNPADLPSRRNIHYVGQMAYANLPEIMNTIKVGIIPYLDTASQGRLQPVKALEYLAGGVPTVTTTNAPLAALTPLIVNTPRDGFIEAVVAAVSSTLPMDEVDELTTLLAWDKLILDVRALLGV